MKRFVAITFLTLMLMMLALAALACFTAKQYVDPVIQDMEAAQSGVSPDLQELKALRVKADVYVPAILFLAGLFLTIALSLTARGTMERKSSLYDELPSKKEPQDISDNITQAAIMNREEAGACQLLSILQNKGGLIDFLNKDISNYSDEQIAIMAKQIHKDCGNALNECVILTHIISEKEGSPIAIPEELNQSEIRLTGNISVGPPFKGSLRYQGWRATRIILPVIPQDQDYTIISPVEVEIGKH
ncbi:MAG: DUF2760 domain-containing protein [Pseudomonadota bacterium]